MGTPTLGPGSRDSDGRQLGIMSPNTTGTSKECLSPGIEHLVCLLPEVLREGFISNTASPGSEAAEEEEHMWNLPSPWVMLRLRVQDHTVHLQSSF